MHRSVSRSSVVVCLLLMGAASTQPASAAAVGDVTSFASDQSTNSVVFTCQGTQKVKLTFCTPKIVKVEFDPAGTFAHATWATTYPATQNNKFADAPWNVKTWPAVSFTTTDEGSLVRIQTSALTVRVTKSPCLISYYDAANTTKITGDAAAMESKEMKLTMSRATTEHFFGFPDEQTWVMDKTAGLDKTGRLVKGRSPIMYSTGGYGVLIVANGKGGLTWDASSRPYPSVDTRTAGQVIYTSMSTTEAENLIYYYFAGPAWKDVMTQFTDVTGKPPLLWKKYFGVARVDWHCEGCFNSGTTQESFDFIAKQRAAQIPADVITMDINGNWAAYGNANPDGTVPKLTALADSTRRNGFILGGQVQGFGVEGYCAGCKGPLYQMPNVQTAVDHGFEYAWYDRMADYTYQEAWAMHQVWNEAHRGDLSRTVVRKGWTAFMAHEFPYEHMGDDLTTSALRTFAEPLEASLGAKVYSGCDLASSPWNVIAQSLRPMITFHDAGAAGSSEEGPAGALKAWTGTADFQNLVRKWHGFHYRLIPYLFSYAGKAHETGVAVWRPMMAEEPTNSATWDKQFQGYVGDWLVQAPYADYEYDYPTYCASGKRNLIWLPQGTWYDFWDGTAHTGPKTIDNYNCNPTGSMAGWKLPLFVKAGAIIPMMPAMEYVGQKPEDTLTLGIWPSGSSSFDLYEDEVPVKTTLRCSQTGSQTDVTIGAFAGSKYCTDASKRRYAIELHGATTPQTVVSAGSALTKQASKAVLDAAATGWFFDGANGGITYAKASGDAATGFTVSFCQTGQCSVVQSVSSNPVQGIRVSVRCVGGRMLDQPFDGNYRIRIFGVNGSIVKDFRGAGPAQIRLPASGGMFIVKAATSRGEITLRVLRGDAVR